MGKQNCWEFKKCGRENGGAKAALLGVCPAAAMAQADGFCDGKNGGRACVYITGTFCSGVIQGTHRDKEKNCGVCDFYKLLEKEEGIGLSIVKFTNYVKDK